MQERQLPVYQSDQDLREPPALCCSRGWSTGHSFSAWSDPTLLVRWHRQGFRLSDVGSRGVLGAPPFLRPVGRARDDGASESYLGEERFALHLERATPAPVSPEGSNSPCQAEPRLTSAIAHGTNVNDSAFFLCPGVQMIDLSPVVTMLQT